MLEMVAEDLLLRREDREVIANKVVDISVIQLAIVKDFPTCTARKQHDRVSKAHLWKDQSLVLDNDLSIVNTKRESTEELFF